MVGRIQTIKHTQFANYLTENAVRLGSVMVHVAESGESKEITTIREVSKKGLVCTISGGARGKSETIVVDLGACTMFELEHLMNGKGCMTAYPKNAEREVYYLTFILRD